MLTVSVAFLALTTLGAITAFRTRRTLLAGFSAFWPLRSFAAFTLAFAALSALRTETVATATATTVVAIVTLLPAALLLLVLRLTAWGFGLGVLAFAGPQGVGFMRGGHNDWTGNIWVCLEARRRCVVVLSNDVRAESEFARIAASILGETGAPWGFVYGSGGQ